MNELSPGILKSVPAGSGGAETVGLGSRSDLSAWVTLARSLSRRPPR